MSNNPECSAFHDSVVHRWTPRSLDSIGRTRLSKNFLLRDFLYCASAAANGFSNAPEHAETVVAAGRSLCEKVLEPLLERYGRFAITYGYQSRESIDHDTGGKIARHGSSPHHWDRGSHGTEIYARVDILLFCIEDGLATKDEVGRWMMMNLDIDLLMEWTRSNVFCITISPKPRRVWMRWGRPSMGEKAQEALMGPQFWKLQFPKLAPDQRPKFWPSHTQGAMTWR